MDAKPEDLIVDAVLDFVEVAVHEYLYCWRIYPVDLYDKWKKYDVPIHICRHVKVQEYIRNMLRSCRQWVLEGRVEKLAIAVRSTKTGALLDKCVMELRLQTYSSKEMPRRQLDELFRRALVDMHAAIVATGRTSATALDSMGTDERTFRLYLHTLEDSTTNETLVPEDSITLSWILAPQEQEQEHTEHKSATLVPVSSSNDANLPLKLNLYFLQATTE